MFSAGRPTDFATRLLLNSFVKAIPIERISTLLGHASVKVTQRHYAPWTRALQEQTDSDLERTWRHDPVLLWQQFVCFLRNYFLGVGECVAIRDRHQSFLYILF